MTVMSVMFSAESPLLIKATLFAKPAERCRSFARGVLTNAVSELDQHNQKLVVTRCVATCSVIFPSPVVECNKC